MRFNVFIRLYGFSTPNGDFKIVRSWRCLPVDTYMRFRWYFDLRAAMIKIDNPKHAVEVRATMYDLSEGDPDYRWQKKNEIDARIRAARVQLTKWDNNLKKFREQWDSFLPVEDDPMYKKAVERVNARKFALQTLIQIQNGMEEK